MQNIAITFEQLHNFISTNKFLLALHTFVCLDGDFGKTAKYVFRYDHVSLKLLHISAQII